MTTTRRGFLAWSAVGGTICVGAAFAPRILRKFRHDATKPTISDDALISALIVVVDTVVHKPFEGSHYADYFKWRMEHLPNYRALYSMFIEQLEKASQSAHQRNFAALEWHDRNAVIRHFAKPKPGDQPERQAPPIVLPSSELEFDYQRHIIAEIISLFASTDAWVLLGYEAWPGAPLGADPRLPPRASSLIRPR